VRQQSLLILHAACKPHLQGLLPAQHSGYSPSIYLFKTPHNPSKVETPYIHDKNSVTASCMTELLRPPQTTLSCCSPQHCITKYSNCYRNKYLPLPYFDVLVQFAAFVSAG
jgi:hypothetical protein